MENGPEKYLIYLLKVVILNSCVASSESMAINSYQWKDTTPRSEVKCYDSHSLQKNNVTSARYQWLIQLLCLSLFSIAVYVELPEGTKYTSYQELLMVLSC